MTKKQAIVSLSSAEAEYRPMVTVTSDLKWTKSFLASMRLDLHQPIQLFCDNQAALHIAQNLMFHEKNQTYYQLSFCMGAISIRRTCHMACVSQKSSGKHLRESSCQTTVSLSSVQVGHYYSTCSNLSGVMELIF